MNSQIPALADTESESQDTADSQDSLIRWIPIVVPLSAGVLVATVGLVWWTVL